MRGGIGVEQNLAESYKWFSLAAAQGDVDSGRKRDDVAKRHRRPVARRAKLAVQTFTAEPQPVERPRPRAGRRWDSAPAKDRGQIAGRQIRRRQGAAADPRNSLHRQP